jgi:UDP-glucuronate 4-epimerase
MKIIITGGAGFIGSHLTNKMLNEGHEVLVIDNFDPFYDEKIKRSNLAKSFENTKFSLLEMDICNIEGIQSITFQPDIIYHLAAKAGVRPSIMNPLAYMKTNIEGTLNMLEFARIKNVKKFIFASSSSVYGINQNIPWEESDNELLPISPYAQSKVSAEFLGYTYSKLYNIDFTALRFFTVYGPGQRPDLAIHKFFKLIDDGKPIQMYGNGNTVRDYTFISDVIFGLSSCLVKDLPGFQVFNLGNNHTVSLQELITKIELFSQKNAIIKYEKEKPGSTPATPQQSTNSGACK